MSEQKNNRNTNPTSNSSSTGNASGSGNSDRSKKLKTLLGKYLRDEVTDQERNAIEAWYQSLEQELPQQEGLIQQYEFPAAQSKTKIRKAILKNIFKATEAAKVSVTTTQTETTKESGKTVKTGTTTEPSEPSETTRRRRIKAPFIKYAAAILLMAVLAFLYQHYQPASAPAKDQVITTNIGSRKTLTLPDGSVIVLNGGGKLVVASDFNKNDRKVSLSGEAFFTIAKDKSRPFVIRSGNLKTTVLGTSFNINAYPELSETKIAVASGKVKVAHSIKGQQEVMLADAMVKNQVLTYNHKTQQTEIKKGDSELLRSWTDSKLYIDNYAIADIAKQLSRHYNVEVVLDPKIIDPAKYTIMLGTENIKTTTEILSELTHHTFYTKQNKLFIMRKKQPN